jgi:hypothetical protein
MASSAILSRYTQFIYFRLKPSIKPEEAGNRDGELFLDILHDATLLSGHVSSAWGRTDEDEHDVVWVIGSFRFVSLRFASFRLYIIPFFKSGYLKSVRLLKRKGGDCDYQNGPMNPAPCGCTIYLHLWIHRANSLLPQPRPRRQFRG